jgi:hypothetical protein
LGLLAIRLLKQPFSAAQKINAELETFEVGNNQNRQLDCNGQRSMSFGDMI